MGALISVEERSSGSETVEEAWRLERFGGTREAWLLVHVGVGRSQAQRGGGSCAEVERGS